MRKRRFLLAAGAAVLALGAFGALQSFAGQTPAAPATSETEKQKDATDACCFTPVSLTEEEVEQQTQQQTQMPPPPEEAKALQREIDGYKITLMREGKYACCVNPGCDMCVFKFGQCPCAKNAQEDKPVCRECKGAWYADEGIIGDKKPEEIKVMPMRPR